MTVHDVSRHQPERPGWRCRACREDWPCARRREELAAEFDGRRVQLAAYLAGHLSDALADRPDAVESVLYLRFVGWCGPVALVQRRRPATHQPGQRQQNVGG